MSTVENYDGLCGIIATFASSGNQIRCTYELGHHGDCSFEKYRNQFRIYSSCSAFDAPWYKERLFVASVMASLKK